MEYIPALTLRTDNEKVYIAPNLKGKTIRKALQLLEQYADGNVDENDVNVLSAFLCDLYGNQFGISDVRNSLPQEDILITAFQCIRAVVRMFVDSVNGGTTPDKNNSVRPIEALNKLYKEIIKQGWTLPDIDDSDFLALMDLLIEREEKHYISELF